MGIRHGTSTKERTETCMKGTRSFRQATPTSFHQSVSSKFPGMARIGPVTPGDRYLPPPLFHIQFVFSDENYFSGGKKGTRRLGSAQLFLENKCLGLGTFSTDKFTTSKSLKVLKKVFEGPPGAVHPGRTKAFLLS